MKKTIAIQLTILLIIYLSLNAFTHEVILPYVNSTWVEEKEQNIQLMAKLHEDLPQIGLSLYKAQSSQNSFPQLPNSLETQKLTKTLFEEFIKNYFEKNINDALQKNLQDLAHQEDPLFFEKKETQEVILPQETNKEMQNTTPKSIPIPADVLKTIKENFNLLWQQLEPSLSFLNIELILLDSPTPSYLQNRENYINHFTLNLSTEQLIEFVFLKKKYLEINQKRQLATNKYISFNFFNENGRQLTDVSLSSMPLMGSISPQVWQNQKGHQAFTEEGITYLNIWQWDQDKKLLSLAQTPVPIDLKKQVELNHLYDFNLFVFIIILLIWFYFFHQYRVNQQKQNELEEKIYLLQKQKPSQEKIIDISTSNNVLKDTLQKQNDDVLTYLIKKEQEYLDGKFDYQVQKEDYLLKGAKSPILKDLIQRLRSK